MINKEKVILMTHLAIYEESQGKEDLDKARFFQHHYVKYNCLKTMVATTFLFAVVVASYIYYNMGELISGLADMDFLNLAYKLIGAYAILVVGFMLIAWCIYTYRYMKAKPNLVRYNQNLKKLIAFYEGEPQPRAKRRKKK